MDDSEKKKRGNEKVEFGSEKKMFTLLYLISDIGKALGRMGKHFVSRFLLLEALSVCRVTSSVMLTVEKVELG
jgi:hypothetical protein